jgi:hypothetical protein
MAALQRRVSYLDAGLAIPAMTDRNGHSTYEPGPTGWDRKGPRLRDSNGEAESSSPATALLKAPSSESGQ